MKRNAALSTRPAARGRERAFTLIELMVLIATLFILAALIVPALALSDDNGARMVCLNNLHQMGMAETMYAGDNRDYLPFCNWDGGDNTFGIGWLYQGACIGLDPGSGIYLTHPQQAWINAKGAWWPYVQNYKSYQCPVDLESATFFQRNNQLSSYLMDGAACGFANGSQPSCKVTDAWNPDCWLLWESDTHVEGAFTFNDGASYPGGDDGPGGIHTVNGAEILTVSGTVCFRTMQSVKADENPPGGTGPGPGGKTYVWWSPFSSSGH